MCVHVVAINNVRFERDVAIFTLTMFEWSAWITRNHSSIVSEQVIRDLHYTASSRSRVEEKSSLQHQRSRDRCIDWSRDTIIRNEVGAKLLVAGLPVHGVEELRQYLPSEQDILFDIVGYDELAPLRVPDSIVILEGDGDVQSTENLRRLIVRDQ